MGIAGVHLDTDFLIHALGRAGAERRRLSELTDQAVPVRMSALAWYEFCRGPRTNQELAVARAFLLEDGVVPFTEDLALNSALTFRRLRAARRRANDIGIGVTAAASEALLLTRNAADFSDIPAVQLESTGN